MHYHKQEPGSKKGEAALLLAILSTASQVSFTPVQAKQIEPSQICFHLF
jgi:hypothetical protein